MKFFLVLAAAVACTIAAPPGYEQSENAQFKSAEANAPIVRSEYESSPEGNFEYTYETGNGISVQANGVVKNPNSEAAALVVTGTVRYTAPDGTPVVLTYTADEDGYHPSGEHLPVGPPIPEAILRSLQYIEAHPPQVAQTLQVTPSYQVAPVPPKRF